MHQQLIGVAILAGGKASRMQGANKALLRYRGESFLTRMAKELDGFDEYLLSASDGELCHDTRFQLVPDVYSDKGPIGGLHALLTAAQSSALLVLPCDMPLYERRLGDFLLSFVGKGYDAWICRTPDGYLHPLCGVYTKACLPAIEACIRQDKLSLLDIYPLVNTHFADTREAGLSAEIFTNINTPEDLAQLQQAP